MLAARVDALVHEISEVTVAHAAAADRCDRRLAAMERPEPRRDALVVRVDELTQRQLALEDACSAAAARVDAAQQRIADSDRRTGAAEAVRACVRAA